jgi:hypothetical protein
VEIVCLDLEGVLVPEIWINFAERTGIEALRATTRDIPDYDVLMKQRCAFWMSMAMACRISRKSSTRWDRFRGRWSLSTGCVNTFR